MTTIGTSLCGMGILALVLPLSAQKPGPQKPGQSPQESGDRAAQELEESVQAGRVPEEAPKPVQSASLRRLIHDLDLGPSNQRGGKAATAYNSLRSLGTLMVPSLLAELDDLGPFGLMNASKLLMSYPDESLDTLVERYLRDASAARQEMASGLLGRLRPQARRRLYPLALESKRDKVRLDGLSAMISLGVEQKKVLSEVSRIYDQGRTSTRTSLLFRIGQSELVKTAQGQALLRRAMVDPEDRLRQVALSIFVEQATDKDEDEVLALLARLGPEDRRVAVKQSIDSGRRWPRVFMKALEFDDLRLAVPGLLNGRGVRLSAQQIQSLLGSQDLNLVRFALGRLAVRKELVASTKPLVELMAHPDYGIRSQATKLLVENGCLMLLESGRFLDLPGQNRTFSDQIKILERVPSGHWVKEMFEVWKNVEKAEILSPGLSLAVQKSSLARLMARQVRAADWPMVESFLRSAKEDPMVAKSGKSGFSNRMLVVDRLLTAGFLTRDLQAKALLLIPSTSADVAMALFNRISEDLVPGEARPDIEGALFGVLSEMNKKEPRPEPRDLRNVLPRGELLPSIFQLLAVLPSSSRDAELVGLIDDADETMASGAVTALLQRSSDPRGVLAAMLESRHSEVLLKWNLQRNELAQDKDLREKTIAKLETGLLDHVSTGLLEDFLENLRKSDRSQVLIKLLGHGGRKLDPGAARTLLSSLGRYREERYLPIFQEYLSHRDDEVRSQAIEAIGKTFSPKAAPLLIEALKDEANAETAREYLVRIDEYIQEKIKWQKRFSGLTPMPAGPSVPKPTKK